jgi:hypothetical protein
MRPFSGPGTAVRQLREIHRHAARLVLAEQLGRRPPTGLVLEVEVAERLPGGGTVRGGGKRRVGVMIAPFPLCAESDAQPS